MSCLKSRAINQPPTAFIFAMSLPAPKGFAIWQWENCAQVHRRRRRLDLAQFDSIPAFYFYLPIPNQSTESIKWRLQVRRERGRPSIGEGPNFECNRRRYSSGNALCLCFDFAPARHAMPSHGSPWDKDTIKNTISHRVKRDIITEKFTCIKFG